MEAIHVLLVEDNLGDVGLMRAMFSDSRSSRFQIEVAQRLAEAINIAKESRPDVILLDLGLPDSCGIGTLEQIIGQISKVPIVVLTGTSDEGLGVLAVTLGAQDYLVKGEVNAAILERSINYAIQRMKTLEELRESNERYVSLFKDNQAVMFLVDPSSHRVVDVNQAAIDFYGHPMEAFIGMDLREIVPPELQEGCKVTGTLPPSTGRTYARHRLAGGLVREVEELTAPIHLNGEAYLYSIVHDVTDRKTAEDERSRLAEEVKEQQWLLRTIIDNAPVGIGVFSGPRMRVKWVNQAYSEICGRLPVDHMRGMRLDDIPCPIPNMKRSIQGMIRDRVPINKDLEMKEKENVNSFVHLSAVPLDLRDEEGGALVILTDITEQVQARKRIEELAARADAEKIRVRTILDNLPVGVLVADRNGEAIEKNPIVDSIFGGKGVRPFPSSENQDFKAWWADNGLPVRPEDWPLTQAIKKGKISVGAVLDILRKDGSRGTVLISASPLRDPKGGINGGVSVLQDITRQRKLEHDAIEAKEQAELYIDLLSHDIRNMNVTVASYLDTARERLKVEGKDEQYFTRPQEILRDSNQLIENVGMIQQIENHEHKHALMDLGWLLEDIRDEFERSSAQPIRITYKTAIKKYVLANGLLKDAFCNLINTSVRNSSGNAEIRISLSKVLEGGREMYMVAVEDNGPGFPDEQKRRLFQGARRGKGKATGTGLDLYLVKKVVDDINGRLWVEDRIPGDPGQGTRFVVLLPTVTNEAKSLL